MSAKLLKNIAIIVILAAAVAFVFALKHERQAPAENSPVREAPSAAQTSTNMESAKAISASLPRMVDLGADKCIPCKMMAPILEDLKKSHADKFEVQFMDVWQNPDSGRKYGIRVIPTQIFFAPDGKELFRHEGFFGKDDILGKWKELGF